MTSYSPSVAEVTRGIAGFYRSNPEAPSHVLYGAMPRFRTRSIVFAMLFAFAWHAVRLGSRIEYFFRPDELFES